MSMTYAEALGLNNVTIPEHLTADAEVPVLTVPQAQGDLLITPARGRYKPGTVVPDSGVQVVHGEATGNTHWLNRGFDSPGVSWLRLDAGQVVGVVTVPAGQTALLVHTDEHGANGIGAGMYEIRRKREQADIVRMVAD